MDFLPQPSGLWELLLAHLLGMALQLGSAWNWAVGLLLVALTFWVLLDFVYMSQPFLFVSLGQEECSHVPEVINIACAFRTICICKWLI